MITSKRFLEGFLKEKAAIYCEANQALASLHSRHFGNPLLQRSGVFLMRDPSKAAIEDVKEAAGGGGLITQEPAPLDAPLRYRYHLSASGETWKITRIDQECFLCRGAAELAESPCPRCKGEAWVDLSGKPR